MAEHGRLLRFSVFEVDPEAGVVRKRGIRVKVGGRPFDFLVILLERPGEVVSREDLRQRLWPADTFVEFDHALNTVVNRLREVLGDSATTPRFIETLPRRGYRFLAPVETVLPASVASAPGSGGGSPPPLRAAEAAPGPAADLAGAPSQTVTSSRPEGWEPAVGASGAARGSEASGRPRSRWPAWALVGLLGLFVWILAVALWQRSPSPAAASGKLMLAVLPFDSVGGGADDRYLSDGLTQEMIAALGGLAPSKLGVIARTTIMRYRQTDKAAAEIGRELAVDYLLEGSVRMVGTRVRVAAQLVETRSQDVLWAQTYERDATDVLMLQRDVAADVARSLALRILPTSAAAQTPQQVPFEAYEAFLRGRYFFAQSTVPGARRAIDYYERATAVAPAFAQAWAEEADAYRLLAAPGWEAEPPVQLYARARALAERALSLAPDLAEAEAVLAMLRFDHEWNVTGAEQGLRRAIALNPNLAQAHQYLSGVLTAEGRFDEAIAAAERAKVLDPLSASVTATVGIRYLYARRYTEALAQLKATLDVTPDYASAHWAVAVARREMGDLEGAVLAMRRAVEYSGGSSYMRAWLAHTLAVAGRTDEARRLEAALVKEASSEYVSAFHFALIAEGLGGHERALDFLERAYRDRSGWMVFLGVQREFDRLRENPRFTALLARVRDAGVRGGAPDTPAPAPGATTSLPASAPSR